MNRRNFLKYLSGALATTCAALLAVPGVRYILASISRQKREGATVQRVARLADLQVGRPVSVAITGSRRDAWTTYPNEPLGQVWLVRRDDESVSPDECQVDAYSSVCPHLRCRTQLDPSQENFVCPCHRGAFDLEGKPISKEQLGHENPAPGPLETFTVQIVNDGQDDWWVEVEYPA
jgi:Rieske Fe-S protein